MMRIKLADVDTVMKEKDTEIADCRDRMRAVGLYLQTLRVMRDFDNISHPERFIFGEKDYDRVLEILEMDDFPEGF